MKAIANFFLRAEHWQIFLLLFAAPTIAEFFVIPTTIRSWHDLGPNGFFFLGVMVLYLLCLLAWFGSMGLFLRSIVSPELRMETQFFRIALVYPVVYVPIFFFLVIPDKVPVWVLLPLHLACMACIFYLLHFVSKNLVLAETGKQASFYEVQVVVRSETNEIKHLQEGAANAGENRAQIDEALNRAKSDLQTSTSLEQQRQETAIEAEQQLQTEQDKLRTLEAQLDELARTLASAATASPNH